MGLVNATPFLAAVEHYRCVHVDGRFGGGKTSLGFAIADYLLSKRGFRYLLTNCRTPWADLPESVVFRKDEDGYPRYADCVVLLDEGGSFLRFREDAEDYLKFLRKMNIVILIPSFDEPTRKLRLIVCQRVVTLESVGLPAWVYVWMVRHGRQNQKATFIYLFPSEIYGVYHSGSMPIDDNGVSEWLQAQSDRLVSHELEMQEKLGMRSKRFRGNYRVREDGTGIGQLSQVAEVRRAADILEEAGEELGDIIPLLEKRQKGRR